MSEITEATMKSVETAQGIYSIFVIPKLRPNSKYNVALCLHDAVGASEIKITIKGDSYQDSITTKVHPLTLQNVEFNIPALSKGEYELLAEGIQGVIFQERIKLSFAAPKPLVIIQTDKGTYKQADLLRFRVLFMDENTKPVTVSKPVHILVYDEKKKLQKQWKNIEYKNGVFFEKFNLPVQPAYGKWLIKVCDTDGLLASKSFNVDKYVLPKYELTLETERNILQSDESINVIVRIKDFRGRVTVSIVPKYGRDKGIVLAEKAIDINEKGDIQFPIMDEMKRRDDRTFEVIAEIKESLLFGDKESIATAVTLHRQRFVFECISYTPVVPCKFQMAIKHIDGSPVLDDKNAVKLSIENMFGSNVENNNFKLFLNDCGMVTFEAILPDNGLSYYYLNFKYLDCVQGFIRSHVQANNERDDLSKGLQFSLLTKKPQLGHPIELCLKSAVAIPYYIYMIVARGKLLKADFVIWPVGVESPVIKFETTFDMVNQVFVLIHYVVNNKLHYAETTIKLENKLENSISIAAPSEARVGECIELKVQSNPNSYVGLLATNQRNYNHLSISDIFMRLSIFEYRAEQQGSMHLFSGGVILTNALEFESKVVDNGLTTSHMEPDRIIHVDMLSNDWETRKPKHRKRNYKEFPENWFFEDIEIGDDGAVAIRKTVPDTPTSWHITGFSLNAETGVAVTENPSTVNTFRPFFISTNLPCKIIRGEKILVPVLVFNFMNQDIPVKVTVHNENKEFKFLECDKEETKCVKFACVPKNSRGCINFQICATNIGQITVKITADCKIAGDALLKILKVVPEGVTVFKNIDFQLFATADEASLKQVTKALEIPELKVANSVFIEATIMGNIFGLNQWKFERLLRKPFGNGEENIIVFATNTNVLRYLECTKEANPGTIELAKQFLVTGFEREMNYRHNIGSFSASGSMDATGSTWLTAYVMRAFIHARKYIYIDPLIFQGGFQFLVKTQAPSGCFSECGKLLNFALPNEFSLTAFVLLALLENAYFAEGYEECIKRGFDYLEQNVDSVSEIHALALALYAFQKRKMKIVPELLARLQLWAINDCGQKWWTKERNGVEENWRTSKADVEITAYVLLASLKTESLTLPIAKWLISQFNSNDDIRPSQTTSLSLEALLAFSEQTGTIVNSNLKVNINSMLSSQTFVINEKNFVKQQTCELPNEISQIICSAHGAGSCLMQIFYRYNILEQQSSSTTFKFSLDIKHKAPLNNLSINFCFEFPPTMFTDEHFITNMTVMEIFLPSGFLAIKETLEKIKKAKNVKHVETQDNDTKIVLYFSNIKNTQKLYIPIEAKLVYGVFNRQSVPIVIYDFYDRNFRAYRFYKIGESFNVLNINHLQATSNMENPNGFNKMLQNFMELFKRS